MKGAAARPRPELGLTHIEDGTCSDDQIPLEALRIISSLFFVERESVLADD